MDSIELTASAETWAHEVFGRVDLGDKRRNRRCTGMFAAAAQYPAGKLTDVFHTPREREAAYRFVENESVKSPAIMKASLLSVVDRCVDEPFVFVAIDGSSVKLADHIGAKDFGTVGTFQKGARGLKVMAGLAVSSTGVPIGLTSLDMWSRKKKVTIAREKRSLAQKETQRVADAAIAASDAFTAAKSSCRVWFQLDRENDATQLLQAFSKTNHWFTVRAKTNRLIKSDADQSKRVCDETARKRALKGTFDLEVSPGPTRTARTARMTIRVAKVTLLLHDRRSKRIVQELPVHAVHVRESSALPVSEEPIEWLLYTNYPIETEEDISLVVFGYCQRWRIEDFFRTWKTTGCNVESTQLHSTHSVRIWATMLAAVAARIERLKHLARTEPYRPATIEFSDDEIEALLLLKQKYKKKTEQIPDEIPTIGQAVVWTAELGGYTGKSSGGPPGSVTIRRGLDRVSAAAETVRALKNQGRLKCD
jgi:hypothetical protein